MSVLLHPATLAVAAFASILAAFASGDLHGASAQEAVTARELETIRGWPYFDPSWRFRGGEARRPARIVIALPVDAEQARRNAALLAIAAE
ncbi:MAG: hypothetical protein AB7O39_02890 [Flavobacteriaceae bacterium]